MAHEFKDYLIEKVSGDDAELNKYLDCFLRNGFPRELSNLKWLHKENPLKKNIIFFATEKTEVASIYTALPMRFRILGKQVNVLQSLDTITDESHRGQGLFPKLAKELFKNAESENYTFIYGFPNENSAPGFFNKLCWTSFGEVPFLLKPLDLSYFWRRFFSRVVRPFSATNHALIIDQIVKNQSNGFEIRQLSEFDSQYEELWVKVAPFVRIGVERNAAYMTWRYINKPMESYHIFGIFSENELRGVVIFALKEKHKGHIGYIMELIVHPDENLAGNQLLGFAKKYLKKAKADLILAWCFPSSFNFRFYRKAGFFRFWKWLRPQKLFFGFLAFDKKDLEEISDIRNWYISYSDSDTV